jgi:hypothetical protein
MKTNKFKRLFVHGLLLVAVLLAGTTAFAESGTSGQGINPVEYPGNLSGNGEEVCRELASIGLFEWSDDIVGVKVDPPGNYDDGYVSVTLSADGKYLDWSATNAIVLAFLVKGGPNYYVYNYAGSGLNSDTGLHSPDNEGGNVPDVSHYNFCYIPVDDNGGQWCSPGYWRQEHHLGSWEATGISPDEKYTDYFSASTLKKGAPQDPTLWQVLQSPQVYGGEAFNNVGDLLSAAHPDVDFQGERVEDSCPLGRAEVE